MSDPVIELLQRVYRYRMREALGLSDADPLRVIVDRDSGDEHDDNVIREVRAQVARETIEKGLPL